MRSITFLLAVLAIAPLTTVAAQEPLRVKVDDRVRVTRPPPFWPVPICVGQPSQRPVETVVMLKANTLVVESQRGTPACRLENALIGGTIGAFAGGAIGYLIGKASEEPCNPNQTCPFKGIRTFSAIIVGALVGGGVGAGIGTAVNCSEEVPLDRLRVSFAPQRDGRFGLGLSVRF